MVQNPKYWTAKECDKTPLGNVNKEKSHFSRELCSVLESGTFFRSPIFWILHRVPVLPWGQRFFLFLRVGQFPFYNSRANAQKVVFGKIY